MTAEPIELDILLAARARLVDNLPRALDADERAFLLSLVRNDPQWDLLGIEHLHELSGVRWKLRNLELLARRSPEKFQYQNQALAERLAGLEPLGST